MDKQTALTLRLELIWWLVTFIILVSVLFPIYKTEVNYPFWTINIIFIIAFVTLTRFLFLLKHTFLAYLQWAKVVVFILCIPLIVFLISEVQSFQVYLDEIGIQEVFDHLSPKSQVGMVNYVRSEMLLFGVGAIVAALLTPFKMLISFWRTHNRGTV